LFSEECRHTYAFGSSTSTKRQGAYVERKNGLADSSPLGPDDPRSGLSAVAARTVRTCAESVRVPDYLRDLLAKPTRLTREPICNGSRPVTPGFKGKPGCVSYVRQIEIHTYNDSVYRDKCHKFYYITIMSYNITDYKIDRTKITISTAP
jgi:hypothetical protein